MPNEHDFPKRLLAVALSAAFPAHGLAQTAARVDFASGNVTATTPGGGSRPLSRGAEVRVGETVSTQNGRAQMRFTDGAFVSLQPQTDFKIENYVFEGRSTQNESAVMSLLKGGMRTITGLVGRTNRDGYKVQTATATVGIRGTEYSISYDEGGSITMYVAGGAIAVTNQTGTTTVPGGRSVSVGGQNSTPQTVNEKPFLSPSGSTPTTVATQTNVVQEAQTPASVLLTGIVPNAGIAAVTNNYYKGYNNSDWYDYPQVLTPLAPNEQTSATLNGAGALISYSSIYSTPGYSFTDTISSGSATVQSAGNDGIIAWGGWSGGFAKYSWSDSEGYSGSEDINLTDPNRSPWFYVVGTPVLTMPTSGSAVYNMIGGLAACAGSWCSSASVVGAQLQVDFGNLAGAHATTLKIDDQMAEFRGALQFGFNNGNNNEYTALSNGPMSPVNGFTASARTYSSYFGSLYFRGEGFFAGSTASRAGMAFTVSEGNPFSEGYYSGVNGVIAYAQAGASGATMFSFGTDGTLKTGAATTLFKYPEVAGTYNGNTTPTYGSTYTGEDPTLSYGVVQIGPSGGVFGFEGYNCYYNCGFPDAWQLTKGTSNVEGQGNDGIIAWGRWTGGTDSQGRDLSANGPFHYIVGVPATALPSSGTYEFSQIGHTASCATICNTATVDSKLRVNYGAMSGNLVDVSVKLDNAAPFTNPSIPLGYFSGSSFTANGAISQGISGPSLSFQGRGFLAGNQSSNPSNRDARAGMAYSVSGTVNSLTGSVNGVIAYGNRALRPPD